MACCLLIVRQLETGRKAEMKTEFTLLIADKNPYVRSFLERELAAEGYQVKAIGTRKELFNCLRSEYPPDLIVMDLDMPVKIAMEVLMQLHSLVPPTPVVVYTNYMEYEYDEKVQWVDAFVEKSGSPEPLKKAIAEVLHSHYAHCIE